MCCDTFAGIHILSMYQAAPYLLTNLAHPIEHKCDILLNTNLAVSYAYQCQAWQDFFKHDDSAPKACPSLHINVAKT